VRIERHYVPDLNRQVRGLQRLLQAGTTPVPPPQSECAERTVSDVSAAADTIERSREAPSR